ncbi:DinB family protein [Zhouia amylolytica]|uniref:DinB-like domain-containing protein n=1 Tax=Zhouia amylolytica AD3 TaxID=1286632 RepID=W2UL37_9FLAO|nr:DinB family protein [Zhouia amylolytica]ETN94156.1 hypothetical protein P278_29600 [Zhouia amylolytica AD3]
MSATELLRLNFSETRRRSAKLWRGIPVEYLNWRPDKNAFSFIEIIRHVLEGEYLYHKIIEGEGVLGVYKSPWESLSYGNVENELDFAQKYRESFIEMIKKLSDTDLDSIRIVRKELGQNKKLGDYLNRMVYHEAVHAGQVLSYLRTLGVDRPLVWD